MLNKRFTDSNRTFSFISHTPGISNDLDEAFKISQRVKPRSLKSPQIMSSGQTISFSHPVQWNKAPRKGQSTNSLCHCLKTIIKSKPFSPISSENKHQPNNKTKTDFNLSFFSSCHSLYYLTIFIKQFDMKAFRNKFFFCFI